MTSLSHQWRGARRYGWFDAYEYHELLRSADVGLIFLDPRFTTPNFPSRLTAYMESSIPIIAATDVNTDLKDVLIESESGFWSVSGDLDSFLNNARRLAQDQELRLKMGLNGRIYLEEHYDVTKTVEILLKHL
jgi:glycosyltransferase involved in cell wall biosynthesis